MHALRGIWNLALLGAKTGFRLRGRYWTWRMETAFGADRSKWPSPAARRKAAIEYGAWVGEMRRIEQVQFTTVPIFGVRDGEVS